MTAGAITPDITELEETVRALSEALTKARAERDLALAGERHLADYYKGLKAERDKLMAEAVENHKRIRRMTITLQEVTEEIQNLKNELNYYKIRFYPLLEALRDTPEIPSPLVLKVLSFCGKFHPDWDEGKRIQREYGLDAVPPVTECEEGAGWWHRVIRPIGPKPNGP